MMRNIKISVIIPVYNMECWIGEAIDSIERQTLKDIEIIIIDDGSTDRSYDFVVKAGYKYGNIRVIRSKNQGSGPARNLGIKAACGEYIGFIDADDFYKSDDSLEFLYGTAKKNNALMCGGSSVNFREGKEIPVRAYNTVCDDGFISKTDYPNVYGFWTFIFQRKNLLKNNVLFPPYIRGQDMVFFIKALCSAEKAYVCRKCVLVHRIKHKTVKLTEDKALDMTRSYRDILRISVNYGLPRIIENIANAMEGVEWSIILYYCVRGSTSMVSMLDEFNMLFRKVGKENILPKSEDTAKKEMIRILEKRDLLLRKWRDRCVFIYGAGIQGEKLFHYMKKNGIVPKAFLVTDKSKNAANIGGISVLSLNDISSEEVRNHDIIIAVRAELQKEILNQLHVAGVTGYSLSPREFYIWQADDCGYIEF